MRLFRDWSSPCFYLSCLVGTAGTVYSVVIGTTIWIITSVCLCFTGTLGAQRAHSLGLARSLGESVDAIREENRRLIVTNRRLEATNDQIERNVEVLEVQVHDLRGISGLLDGTEQDLRDVETRLRATYQGIEKENRKHQNNNLVSLFSLVDQNKDGVLTPPEVDRLGEYVIAVYDKQVDFPGLDTNGDGNLTLPEFIQLFNTQA
jgi:hypothetical protein